MKLDLPRGLRDGLEARRYVADADRLQPGNELELLVDGAETYPAMLEAIAAASRYVDLETYIFEYDTVGHEFIAALVERARAGVSVRLLVDGIGSRGLDDEVGTLLDEAGVELAVYSPLHRRFSPRRWLRRDHRKILVVDGRVAFVGGLNIGRDYAPVEVGGHGWRDTHLMVRGPVVADLEALFATTWEIASGQPYPRRPADARETSAGPDSEWAMAIGTDHSGRRSDIRRHIMHALRSARSRVWCASAYFVPDLAMRRAFRAAAQRGVDVRIIVPREGDLRSVQWAGEYTYARLMRDGVRLFGWRGSHMHAKTIVVDGVWSMVGSYNLDYVSLFLNQEVVLIGLGKRTGGRLERQHERDLHTCDELALDSWLARPWWQRALAWWFYKFRRFL